MASSGKKEYTLKINGLAKNITDATKLEEVLKRLDTTIGQNSTTISASTQASRTRAVTLTEEEKAEKKLAETIDKTVRARTDANRAQVDANQAARESQRQVVLEQQAINASANSVEAMRAKLALLKNEWKGLDVGSEKFREMSIEINTLNDKIKEAEQSTGDFRRNVGNYQSALSGLEKLSGGIDNASKSSMGLAQSMLATNQFTAMFGDQSEESAEQAKQLQKILALLSIIQGVNNNLLKSGIAVTKTATLTDRVHTLQVRARANAIALSTKNTLAATIAQRAFNIVASANPYVLLALALVAVVGALVAFSSDADKAAVSGERYASAIDGVTFATEEARDAHDELSRKLRDIQIDIDVTTGKLTAYQAALLKLNNTRMDAREEALKKYNETVRASMTELTDTYNSVWVNLTNGFTNASGKALAKHDALVKAAKETLEAEWAGIDKLNAANKAMEDAKDGVRKKGEEEQESKKQADAAKASLEKQKQIILAELRLLRQAEDDKTGLILNEFDQRREATRLKYERQREDYEKQLAEDKTLTEKGQEAIRGIISNINAHWEAEDQKTHDEEIADRLEKEKKAEAERKEIIDKRIADADRRNNILLNGLDLALEEAQQKIGDIVVRNKGGLELIDVDATRANLDASNKALDEYIAGIKKAQAALKVSHEATLKDLKEGTPEYEEELQKFAAANLQLNSDLAGANKAREANTKASNEVLTEHFSDMFEKVGKFAEAASMAVSSVVDTLNMGLQMQIDNLSEQLEEVTERYEEVQKLREESTERVEELEARLQSATGGTAAALKEQLQDEIHNRGELEREEARLQKEKEKREAEIAKKEKQMKRNNMISSIAQTVATTAMAVVQALAAAPPPFNFALAALVGAMGAAQVGMMTKQLTKMEDGGLINGPSHANGGARIHGTNIEVEGGEYVINKKSTAANTRLVEFINSAKSTVTAADLVGLVPGESGNPIVINNNTQTGENRILEALENINFQPTVAVTDIIDVSDAVVSVRDIAGF